jgi:hypothetical protein
MEEKVYNEGLRRLDKNIKLLKQIKTNIKQIDKKYKNNFIHVSQTKLTLDNLFNTNNQKETRYGGNNYVYFNPEGLWISCGSSWYKYLVSENEYFMDWLNFKYTYDIEIDKTNVLHIKTLKGLIKFHYKYINKNDYHILNWNKIKDKYDGLIICPFLGYKIWKKYQPDLHIHKNTTKYINQSIGKNLKKYPSFFLEWYRHWEAGTGVIWKKNAVKKFNLIKFNKI